MDGAHSQIRKNEFQNNVLYFKRAFISEGKL